MTKRNTLLHIAAASGHRATLVKLLQDEHVNVDCRNDKGQTPLHMAAINGAASSCELLIKAGAHIYVTNNEGMTPLHLATTLNHPDCVTALLKYGSNPYLRDSKGRSSVEMITSASIAECYLTFFSITRYNPALLRRLEKDIMQKEIDDILQTCEYESFTYEGSDDENCSSDVPQLCRPATRQEALFHAFAPTAQWA
eukprot:TRINITY_DN2340_c0_g1_i1.p1 TRINITY_DN2340_c0_g1~~TRINITY_DN2340_c0_g1_i1.p1  ORF type:complete len:221 (+),score=45.57 TRINITY_DN2340_c0_g1_i1:74-664(+)